MLYLIKGDEQSKPYTSCKLCGRGATSWKSLREHWQNEHPDDHERIRRWTGADAYEPEMTDADVDGEWYTTSPAITVDDIVRDEDSDDAA